MNDLTDGERDLLAQTVFTQALSMELLCELATEHSDPGRWINEFTSRVHQRIDAHAENHPQDDWPHIHEAARIIADTVGQTAMQLTASRRGDNKPSA